MTTTQLRPDGVYLNQWSVIEQSSADAALNDNADNSSVRGTFALDQCRIAFSSVAMPAGSVVRSITPIARVSTDASPGAYFQYQMTIANVPTVGTSYTSPTITNVYAGAAPINLTLTGLTGNYSQSDIDNLGFSASAGIITGTSHPFIHELYCNVLYVPPPTVVATGPSGTLTVNNPTVTWVHQPGADAPSGQDQYRVRVYDATNLSVIVYDTGNVASAAGSAVVGPLALGKTYRAYVNTMQTTSGVGQWSPDSFVTFSLDVNAPTVTVNGPTGVQGTTSPTVSWTHHPGTGAQTGQTFYRVRMFNTSNLLTPVTDTGAVASSASSAVIGPLDPAISWRAVVNTAQTTYGVVQWSPDVFTNFTINVTPPPVFSVTATPNTSIAAINVLVAATPSSVRLDGSTNSFITGPDITALAGATSLTVEVDCSLDDWTPAAAMQLAGQFVGGASNDSWRVYVNTPGTLVSNTSPNGTTQDIVSSSAVTGLVDGTRHTVGYVWTAVAGANSTVQFRIDGANFGALLSTTPARAGGLFNSTYPVRIGVDNAGNLRTTGNIYAVRLYVGGVLVASPDFTTLPVGQTSVTDAQGNLWTIGGAVVKANPSPVWQTMDVQATYDGGVTWAFVRGATGVAVNGTTASVIDYEAPNGVAAQYRARAARISGGVSITSAWVLSNVTMWRDDAACSGMWLKDPAHPSRNMRLDAQQPDVLYDRPVGVFRPIGSRFPVVVSDVLQAGSTTMTIVTRTDGEAASLRQIVQAAVLLFQTPSVAGWQYGSRYAAPGALQEAHTNPAHLSQVRVWTLALVEVARPPDDGVS